MEGSGTIHDSNTVHAEFERFTWLCSAETSQLHHMPPVALQFQDQRGVSSHVSLSSYGYQDKLAPKVKPFNSQQLIYMYIYTSYKH